MGAIKASILRGRLQLIPVTYADNGQGGQDETWNPSNAVWVRAQVHIAGAAALKSGDFFADQQGGREIYFCWCDNRVYRPKVNDRAIHEGQLFDVYRVVHQGELSQIFIKEVP